MRRFIPKSFADRFGGRKVPPSRANFGCMKYSPLFCTLSTVSLFVACSSTSSTPATVTPGVAGGGDGIDSGTFTGEDGGAIVSKCGPLGEAIEHKTDITADETWGEGLHVVSFSVSIKNKATLTVLPCAVVRFQKEKGIFVGGANAGEEGTLVAEGEIDRAIVFEGESADRWNDLLVYPKGSARLRYATIRGGGGDFSRAGGSLHLYGDPALPMQTLAKVEHVTIEGSGKYGAVLETHGGFSLDSTDLTIRGSGDMALLVSGSAVKSIPSGSYKGNTNDSIRLVASKGYDQIVEDQTIHDRGVPYFIGGDKSLFDLTINSPTTATLTIEAGVTLKFPKSDRASGLFVYGAVGATPAKGILKVAGTAEKPVVFTSAEAAPEAGDWVGVEFRDTPDAANNIEHLRVEYAGGETGASSFSCGTPGATFENSTQAAILILGQPASQFVKNSVITHSAQNGFERGWTGTDIDFLSTNTFENIAFCTQTAPRPSMGVCADPAPCPK